MALLTCLLAGLPACPPACLPAPPFGSCLQKRGKVRHVGATNFDVQRLREMTDAGVRIVNNQARAVWMDGPRDLGAVGGTRSEGH